MSKTFELEGTIIELTDQIREYRKMNLEDNSDEIGTMCINASCLMTQLSKLIAEAGYPGMSDIRRKRINAVSERS